MQKYVPVHFPIYSYCVPSSIIFILKIDAPLITFILGNSLLGHFSLSHLEIDLLYQQSPRSGPLLPKDASEHHTLLDNWDDAEGYYSKHLHVWSVCMC